jgi:hypothetical protein
VRHLLCYGDWKFEESKQLLITSAKQYGIDVIHSFGSNDLKSTEFYKKYKKILDAERGGGYWLWKPFFMNKVIHQLPEGDILLYLDCGAEVIAPLEPLFTLLEKQDIVLFKAHGHFNKQWVKKDVFVALNCDKEEYWDAEMLSAGYQMYSVSAASKKFIGEWLQYCTQDALITDDDNVLGFENHKEFRENRHDQAILSVLAKRNNIRLWRDPSQNGNDYIQHTDTYSTIFNLHRSRKKTIRTTIIEDYLRPLYLYLFKK